MKTLFLSVLLALGFTAAANAACPGEKHAIQKVSLDANGVVTRTEMREMPAPDFDESQKTIWKDVVTDSIRLENGDVVTLNAAPSMVDAMLTVTVKRSHQVADAGGVVSTTYAVRETMTSGWSGQIVEKNAYVKIESSYLGGGKSSGKCGKVTVKKLPNSTVPTVN